MLEKTLPRRDWSGFNNDALPRGSELPGKLRLCAGVSPSRQRRTRSETAPGSALRHVGSTGMKPARGIFVQSVAIIEFQGKGPIIALFYNTLTFPGSRYNIAVKNK
jgi:hypothetical protein